MHLGMALLTLRGNSGLVFHSSHLVYSSQVPPVTLAHLLALRDTLDLENAFDAVVFSTVTVAFWCQCHLDEVCVTSMLDPLLHATRASRKKSGKMA